jgi:hypothetical protein
MTTIKRNGSLVGNLYSNAPELALPLREDLEGVLILVEPLLTTIKVHAVRLWLGEGNPDGLENEEAGASIGVLVDRVLEELAALKERAQRPPLKEVA